MKNNQAYWQRRDILAREHLLDKLIEQSEKDIKALLLRLRDKYIDKIEALALQIEKGHLKSINPYYLFNRYNKLLASLDKELRKMGVSTINLLSSAMKNIFVTTESIMKNDFPVPFTSQASIEDIINSEWVGDGKRWSQRIWENEALLSSKIQEGLLQMFAGAITGEQLTQDIEKAFSTNYYRASRIVRTEYVHVANVAVMNRFTSLGLQHYQWLSAIHNERTCKECLELNGQVFPVGDTASPIPPGHCFCRCTIIPVEEELIDALKNIQEDKQ